MFLRGGLRRSLSYTTKIISPATGAPSHPVNDSNLRNMRDTEWQRRSLGMRGPRLELRDHPPCFRCCGQPLGFMVMLLLRSRLTRRD
ncbi:hypothetical protein BP00DRAFT_217703 [Aspergillus indologenus CBS 114.80]|uniref:Uncharacterized protein n=1 Tax=Aspergillus indologenus CBS 114.80 TaxID=1450541 RepID=A0A2V5JAT0_9EURO|nr:hypothetical protein BP00DRAFT_217703 [Aspergillus indologenus CBS 114.80]